MTSRHRGQRRRAALTAKVAGAERDVPADPPALDRVLASDDRVVRALGTLPERDRELLMLVAWEGLEPAQLAAALGVSRGTANVRVHRARRRLATALAADHRRHLKEAIE